MDDWQDHALSTRHMHNRNSRRPSGKGRKGGTFDVRKAFGEYEVKCPSYERALRELRDGDGVDGQLAEPQLELLRLTDDGQGVLGELVLPGLLRATVVLAATRRGLALLTRALAGDASDDEDDEDVDNDDNAANSHSDDDDEEEEEDRFTTFEKNSFRTPKFWLAWNGPLTLPPASPPPTPSTPSHPSFPRKHDPADSPPPSPTLHRTGSSFPPPKPAPSATPQPAEGTGYVVFAGNECRKFRGTVSCAEWGWRDVAFGGFKTVGRGESERGLVWGGRDVETGWREAQKGDGEWGARVDARRRVVFD
ncbi:hypothetical protein C7974DRAFT_414489 [Boeremia exigua]|uniref:uncharacterized protein n=1 Tax=Boeremia exigua TaxID=749465 RepID=UPI001E8D6AE0|nr:uncharacterized protein C7974DRAFT_414489 [Boeremia exigua]KAH6621793.1 hypothetical protein C7974DRAFT_414489 [Boeremia exigua]